MSGPVNPTTVSWTNPTKRVDNTTDYGEADNAGYDIAIDGQPAVSIPAAWATTFNLADLAGYGQLADGQHDLAIRVVDKMGNESAFSQPTAFEIDLVVEPPPPVTPPVVPPTVDSAIRAPGPGEVRWSSRKQNPVAVAAPQPARHQAAGWQAATASVSSYRIA